MMVDRAPHLGDLGQFMNKLDKAAEALEAMNQKSQAVSKQDLDNLTKILQQLNQAIPSSWGEKKFVFEGMNDKVAKILLAIQLFQTRNSAKEGASQRNVEQVITSLVSSFNSSKEKERSDKTLKNLREYKIGRRVEKTHKGKESKNETE